ncbi:MAG: IS3 family transposase [Candidatus Marinimicrobia bacterium]|nr:IS3 family transposase [Candidatus Neomarinimicrobiota bacterium]
MKQPKGIPNRRRKHTRRKYTPEEKIAIVMRGIDTNCVESKISKELGVPNSTFHIWRLMFIESGKDRLRYGKSHLAIKEEFLGLRDQNKRFKRSIEKLEIKNKILRAICSQGLDIKKHRSYTVSEKMFIIDLIENSGLVQTYILNELGLSTSSHAKWRRRYKKFGIEGLKGKPRETFQSKIATPEYIKQLIRELIHKYPYIGDEHIKWYLVDNYDFYLTGRSIYKIRKKENLYHEVVDRPKRIYVKKVITRTKKINEIWHSDFTFLRRFDGDWHYLTIVMDDFSFYVVSWELTRSMTGKDAVSVFRKAIKGAHYTRLKKEEWPTILTDHGPCYKSKVFQSFVEEEGLKHRMAAPRTFAERIRIEHSFRSLKRALSIYGGQNPEDLKKFVGEYYSFYNNNRSHYGLNHLTPANVYFGDGEKVTSHRNRVRIDTLKGKGLYLDENRVLRRIESDTL